jgi:hypothetical protein
MEFKFKEKTYIEVWESDFSGFVADFYQRPYRLQQQDPMKGQNSYVKMTVKQYDDDDWDYGEKCLAEWLALPVPEPGDWVGKMNFERETPCDLEVILWDLCRKGAIPEGEYFIDVWW